MILRLLALVLILAAGCRSTSTDTVFKPELPEGMEIIEVPGSEEVSRTPASTLPPEEPEASDKLVPGDYIVIQVYDQPTLSLQLGIPMSGVVNYPVIGKVQLAERTIGEVEEDIKSRLEEKMLNCAQVTVIVKYYNRRSVYVLGNVNEPGSFAIPFGKPLTLLQAVSMAQGFSDNADKDNIILMRSSGGSEKKRTAYKIAYSDIVKKGNLEKDVKLKDGDIVIVQERGKVYVLGKVKEPGGFTVPADEKMTLTKAISLAKGFDPLASQSRTTVIRTLPDGTTRIFRINAGEVFKGTLRDPVVLPGDIIFVPESFF
jgi:polysaccharide export outer membrane protein